MKAKPAKFSVPACITLTVSALLLVLCIINFMSVLAYADDDTSTVTETVVFMMPVSQIDQLSSIGSESQSDLMQHAMIVPLPEEVAFPAEKATEDAETSESNDPEIIDEDNEESIPSNLSDNELTIYTALRNAGLSKTGTAAVMGCMSMESGLQVTAENPNDGGYGLLQWTYSRKTDLFNWCYETGNEPDSVSGQVAFFMHELQSKYSSAAHYKYPVYETLTSDASLEDCLAMFFSHMEAGVNVPISSTKAYSGTTTLQLFRDRLNAAHKYY